MSRCYPILVLLVLLLALPTARAQENTFTVTVATKTSDHPYNGQGWPEGYVIDGDQGAELTLVRGETYTFQMSNVPVLHPFYISTSATGGDGGASAYDDGVTGNGASGNATLTFEGNQLFVADHDSLNGVYVRVDRDAPTELRDGAIFRIGQELLRFNVIEATPPSPDSEPSAASAACSASVSGGAFSGGGRRRVRKKITVAPSSSSSGAATHSSTVCGASTGLRRTYSP